MALVRTLHSTPDEVNAAMWHPKPGNGIIYGTKEGRVRRIMLNRTPPSDQHDGSHGAGVADHDTVLAFGT